MFLDIGVPGRDLDRAEALSPEALRTDAPRSERAAAVLEALLNVGLSAEDVAQVLLKWPQAFSYDVDTDINPVLTFLRADVGLTTHDVKALVTSFPVVLSYNVKAHLRPTLAYLISLGVSEEIVPQVVLARPLLLGEGLDTLVRFLRGRGVPRMQVHRLLRSYPLDYRLHFRGIEAAVKRGRSG